MPCSDSSSSLCILLDHDEKFISFEYAKITCGSEIDGGTGLSRLLFEQTLPDILALSFPEICRQLNCTKEESQFILYLEWDALRCALCEYLGLEDQNIDRERCKITNIEHHEKGIDVALVILPPKELPKIVPCSLREKT